MNLVPAFVRRRLAHRPNLVKILDNIGWLFLDKVLRMGVGLLVGVWIARYLGPEQFGLFNFALAFTGLFAAISGMGLQGIVVRAIVRDPQSAPLTLGTAAVLMLIGGFVSYLLILAAIAYLRPNDPLARSIVAILGAIQLFKASEIAVYWFESQVQSKYTVWVQNGVFLIFAAVKVGLILSNAPLTAFVWATLAEAAVVAVILLVVWGWRGPSFQTLRASIGRAKILIKDAWPLMLSGMAIMIYMKIDQIMLAQMIGERAVGLYSAAMNVVLALFFLPVAIVSSANPTLIEVHKTDPDNFYRKIGDVARPLVFLSTLGSVSFMILSEHIVIMLYGGNYKDSAAILALLSFSLVFVSIGHLGAQWYVIKGLQKKLLWIYVAGALANVAGNAVLVPSFGAIGAAAASLFSYALVNLVLDIFVREARPLFLLKIASLNPLPSIRLLFLGFCQMGGR